MYQGRSDRRLFGSVGNQLLKLEHLKKSLTRLFVPFKLDIFRCHSRSLYDKMIA